MVFELVEGSHSLVNVLRPLHSVKYEGPAVSRAFFLSNLIIPDWVQLFTHVSAGKLLIVL